MNSGKQMQFKQLLTAGAVFLVASLPVQATTIMDNYIGADDHRASGPRDVIGDNNLFDIFGMDVSVSGNMLSVSIHTNFAGRGDDGLFSGSDGRADLTNGLGIGYGDLFLSSGWNPNPADVAPYENDDNSNGNVWTYGFALDNRYGNGGTGTLYALSGSNDDSALLAEDFLTGGTFRNGQEVAVDTRSMFADNVGTGSWSIDEANKRINFEVSLLGTTLVDASEIGLHWGETCGNDTIEGGASVVPVPAAVWLFGSGLLGLVGIARRKA